MRFDVPNAACSHAVVRLSPRLRPFLPFRSFRNYSHVAHNDPRDSNDEDWSFLNPHRYKRRVQPNLEARRIAVVGGGIAGLSTAFFLSRSLPHAKVTVFEKSSRLGGWLDSEHVNVDGGQVLFEWGPRSLRPDQSGSGAFTQKLLEELVSDTALVLIGIPKGVHASRNRFVYYGDGLVQMPSPYGNPISTVLASTYKVLTEPLFKGFVPSLLAEPSVRLRPSFVRDESVGDFLRRRFGKTIADNLASALFHGIYAGDIYKLSARTLLPSLWYLETRDRDHGQGVLMEIADLFFKGSSLHPYRLQRSFQLKGPPLGIKDLNEVGWGNLEPKMKIWAGLQNCSMYTFANGLQELATALQTSLGKSKNVTVHANQTVKEINYNTSERTFTLTTSSPATDPKFDYVVSTLAPNALLPTLSTSPSPLPLTQTTTSAFAAVSKSVNVMVVNLYYSETDLLPASLQGFGYLIPRTTPLESNPERALGVIFSSFASGVRGPDSIQRIPLPTADELAAKRNHIGIGFQKDPSRLQTTSDLEAYETELENDPDHPDHASDIDGTPVAKLKIRDMKRSLESHEKQTKDLLARLERDEAERRKPGAPAYREVKFGQDTAPGTKLTVMLGGHWWDGWAGSDLPTESEAVAMSKAVLRRHINITAEPEVAKARLQKDCIPQYPVGYRDYMAEIHEKVLKEKFGGRLKVAGAWWQGGVGVNDCVRKALETSVAVYEGWDECTGLEEYVGEEKWCLIEKRTNGVRSDPMCKA